METHKQVVLSPINFGFMKS